MNQIFFLLLVAILFIGCSDDPTSEVLPDPLDYTKMEIHYKKVQSGDIKSSLDAMSDGSLETHGYNTTLGHDLDSSSDLLAEEKDSYAQLFAYFNEFDRVYGPDSESTTYTMLEFIYESVPDTVTVTSFLTVPSELQDIIDALEATIDRLTNIQK